MDAVRGRVVLSKAGRDKGKFLVICSLDGRFAFVADGKERPLKRPKRKNLLHLAFTKTVVPETAFRSDKELRKTLRLLDSKEVS